MNILSLKRIKFLLLAITFLFIFGNVKHFATGTPINSDGLSNLHYAYAIAHHGTMGVVSSNVPQTVYPSNEREPFPNWLTAQWIKYNPALFNDSRLHQEQSPSQLIRLKTINIWLVMFTLIGIFVLAQNLFQSYLPSNWQFLLAYITVLLSYACMHIIHVDFFITEIHGAFLMVWFSWAWFRLLQTQHLKYSVLAGALLGLLILTKAAFLYISTVVLVSTLLIYWMQHKPKRVISNHIILLFVTLVMVLPWMYRNYVYLGKFEVAGRGPIVLMTRAYKSQMTDEEFKGAFYAYAPASLKKTMRKITGFNGRDRELGGRLQRFYRAYAHDETCRDLFKENCAIAYYYQASIRYNIIMRTYQQLYPNDVKKATLLGEKAAKSYAINLIKNNPWGHLRTTLVFAWRGAWPCNTVDGRWYKPYRKFMQPAWEEIIPFMGLIAMFGLAITALVKKQDELIAFTWLGSATFLFYSLATHFIPRYSEMMIPIWVLCFVYGFMVLTRKLLGFTKPFTQSN